ncbi:hypothetical protein CONLIGDRAFT_694006 [Coniochaeta ligniaria NRRL 30616]|uniref:Uncharacterized protein n=1 Tax=Coniochaeta ligniaria NRRL 30616 TaxID=1408157 RepID=A0A1J7IQJ5_9PEZI|nr:hypothetical protein CONLIGDRAFT_694006 [Coniochaeta ligniaria NRRL 30616]
MTEENLQLKARMGQGTIAVQKASYYTSQRVTRSVVSDLRDFQTRIRKKQSIPVQPLSHFQHQFSGTASLSLLRGCTVRRHLLDRRDGQHLSFTDKPQHIHTYTYTHINTSTRMSGIDPSGPSATLCQILRSATCCREGAQAPRRRLVGNVPRFWRRRLDEEADDELRLHAVESDETLKDAWRRVDRETVDRDHNEQAIPRGGPSPVTTWTLKEYHIAATTRWFYDKVQVCSAMQAKEAVNLSDGTTELATWMTSGPLQSRLGCSAPGWMITIYTRQTNSPTGGVIGRYLAKFPHHATTSCTTLTSDGCCFIGRDLPAQRVLGASVKRSKPGGQKQDTQAGCEKATCVRSGRGEASWARRRTDKQTAQRRAGCGPERLNGRCRADELDEQLNSQVRAGGAGATDHHNGRGACSQIPTDTVYSTGANLSAMPIANGDIPDGDLADDAAEPGL